VGLKLWSREEKMIEEEAEIFAISRRADVLMRRLRLIKGSTIKIVRKLMKVGELRKDGLERN
jgi:hypothetical protein